MPFVQQPISAPAGMCRLGDAPDVLRGCHDEDQVRVLERVREVVMEFDRLGDRHAGQVGRVLLLRADPLGQVELVRPHTHAISARVREQGKCGPEGAAAEDADARHAASVRLAPREPLRSTGGIMRPSSTPQIRAPRQPASTGGGSDSVGANVAGRPPFSVERAAW